MGWGGRLLCWGFKTLTQEFLIIAASRDRRIRAHQWRHLIAANLVSANLTSVWAPSRSPFRFSSLLARPLSLPPRITVAWNGVGWARRRPTSRQRGSARPSPLLSFLPLFGVVWWSGGRDELEEYPPILWFLPERKRLSPLFTLPSFFVLFWA